MRLSLLPICVLSLLFPSFPCSSSHAQGDAEPPVLDILSHGDRQTVSSQDIRLSGTARDSGSGLRAVEVRINGGEWVPAEGGEVWRAELRLEEGRNTISVRAVDIDGNEAVETVSLSYSPGTPDGRGPLVSAPLVALSVALVSWAALPRRRGEKDR